MHFNHPIVPLLGRLLMSYMYLTSGFTKIIGDGISSQIGGIRHVRLYDSHDDPAA
jgi:uncharacterized membrane protein YphA (DoxX/SURF4 family)